jgi:glutathione S-transferase
VRRLKIYGDPISGNCLKVKWTADYLGVDHDWIALDILKGETRNKDFLAINPFGQIPTAFLPDGRTLTQSGAIIMHLAETADGDLLPRDAYERARVYQWLFWEQNSHEPYIAGRRFRKAYLGHGDDKIDAEWLPRGHAALQFMDDALANSDFLAAQKFTLADIALVAYTRMAGEGGFSLDDYPAVRAWIGRVEGVLRLNPVESA